MADIEVTAGDDMFSFFSELVDVMKEVVIEFQLVVKHFCPISSFTPIGEIDIE
jgi:hypothetical protein